MPSDHNEKVVGLLLGLTGGLWGSGQGDTSAGDWRSIRTHKRNRRLFSGLRGKETGS